MSSEESKTATSKNYKQMLVWQKTRVLAKEIFQATAAFPKEERYGLSSQIRRAVVSIYANLAEGYGRNASREFAHFSSIAYGSATEVEALIILAADLEFLNSEKSEDLLCKVDEILRMLNGLRQTLRKAA